MHSVTLTDKRDDRITPIADHTVLQYDRLKTKALSTLATIVADFGDY